MKFRKKPVVIEAEQFLPDTSPLPFSGKGDPMEFDGGQWIIRTLEGPHHVSNGDWVMRGIKGEFYACKPDIFTASYERVAE